MITYSQLYSWRNLCEFLDSRYYKFAEYWEIKAYCKKCLPALYAPKRIHREMLYELYLIQLIKWCDYHPLLNYSNSRSTRREFKDVKGWQLCSDWEAKIDFLESVVLFGVEPITKSWEPRLKLRIQQRAEREAKLKLEKELRLMKHSDRLIKASLLGICHRCFEPIAPLMIDCITCGAKQE